MSRFTSIVATVAFAGLAAGATPALAGGVIAVATNSTQQSYHGDGGVYPLKLTDAGANVLSFSTTKPNELVAVGINFDCYVSAPGVTHTQSVTATATVDGHEMNPIGATYACPSTPTGDPVLQSVVLLRSHRFATPGIHQLQVLAGSAATTMQTYLHVSIVVQY
jgi:hypothetical protein